MNKPHVANNSGCNEWYTPAKYIDAARDVMGEIDLDPASSAEANRVVRAKRFYSIDDNGLEQKWYGRVWMNPPYAANLVKQFCWKLLDHLDAGDITEAIVLVNNATETVWFQALAEVSDAMVLVKTRIRYWNPDKDSLSPLQGQVILYFGSNAGEFVRGFSKFGVPVVPYEDRDKKGREDNGQESS